MGIEQEFPISVAKIRRHDEKTMILRMSVGGGETEDGEEFDISTNVGDGSPTWYFHNEKRYYSVSLQDLTHDVINSRNP